MVDQTLGKHYADATPPDVSRVRILDPACGTGCFLVGAYQYVLDWHRDWYVRNGPAKHRRRLCKTTGRQWRLTYAEKERILLNNIYGVDIDCLAVEAAKSALWQKLLEGEAGERRDGAARIDLSRNIKCGDSLIRASLESRTRALDWPKEFAPIMKHGGFDIVLGNPPYGAALDDIERSRLAKEYQAGTTDTAALFMLLALRLTKPRGWNAFIVPKSFTYSANWKRLRACLLENLSTLTDVGKVWADVKLEQVIYLLQKQRPSKTYGCLRKSEAGCFYVADIPKSVCSRFGFLLNGINPSELALGCKIRQAGAWLGDLTTNARGAMLQNCLTERGASRRVIGGKQIERYLLQGAKGYFATNRPLPSQALVKPGSILVQNIVAHVANPSEHIKIIGTVASEAEARSIAILDTVNQLRNRSRFSSHYLLGLLHSRLINWYVYRFIFAKAIRTMHFDGPVSKRIPIPNPDLANPVERSQHDRLAALVKRTARLHKRRAATNAHQQERLKREIATNDRQIDELVYTLYSLTAAEIALIEKTERADDRPILAPAKEPSVA
jgi:hypothetical protein